MFPDGQFGDRLAMKAFGERMVAAYVRYRISLLSRGYDWDAIERGHSPEGLSSMPIFSMRIDWHVESILWQI